MISRPRLKPTFHATYIAGEGVLLLTEHRTFRLVGPVYEQLVPLMDGTLATDELVEQLSHTFSPESLYYGIDTLARQGFLCEGNASGEPLSRAFWWNRGVAPGIAASTLESTHVHIEALTDLPTGDLEAALSEYGLSVGSQPAIKLLVVEDYLQNEMRLINSLAWSIGNAWMLIKPVGATFLIGPLFVPGRTGCWECLRHRYISTRKIDQFIMTASGRTDPPRRPQLRDSVHTQIAMRMASSEVATWVATGSNARIEGGILSVDTRDWTIDRHRLIPRPTCPVCGRPSRNDPTQPRLVNRPATYNRDGGLRICAPKNSFESHADLISPLIGIVHPITRVETTSENMHVYSTGHNCAIVDNSFAVLRTRLRNTDSGKGINDWQAKASALFEAIEHYSGIFQGSEERIVTSFSAGSQRQLIHPNDCMLFSDRQFQQRHSRATRGLAHARVPEPFDSAAPIEWSPVWSLTSGEAKYLPTEYLYYDYRPSNGVQRGFCVADSNGCAAGNCLEEAVLQGALELIERDSIAIWWYNRLSRRAVDLRAMNDDYVESMLSWYESNGRELWVLDITSDLAVPTFVAVSRKSSDAQEHVILGFGAHLNPRIALLRSLTELNQSFAYLTSHTRDRRELNSSATNDPLEWWRWLSCSKEQYLLPSGEEPLVSYDWSSRWHNTDLMSEISIVTERLFASGMETLILDQSRPETGVFVVKVLVPGLRHFWPRFRGGRLFDVPVRMGWVTECRGEEALNPLAVCM